MARRCKYGKLKHPVGGRICKRRPTRAARKGRGRKRWSEAARYRRDRERDLAFEIAKSFGRLRRRRR